MHHITPPPFPGSIFDTICTIEEQANTAERVMEQRHREHEMRLRRRISVEEKERKAKQALLLWEAMCNKDYETLRNGLVDICEHELKKYELATELGHKYIDVIALVKQDIETIKSMSDEEILTAGRMYLSPPLFT